MEIQFQAQTVRYLAEKRCDDLHQEQTGELQIPESMPELGRVTDCFGSVLVAERRVDSGSVTVTGSIQAGVLYIPEGEEGLERLSLTLPFTVTKKIPTQADSVVFANCWLRSLEARFVNSRKLLLRAGLCSELTLLSPTELTLRRLSDCPQGLVCKTETYPMRLPLCAAEREVRIADEVLMPEDGPGADRLLKAQCAVRIAEQRVVGDKAVFQGALALRILAASEDGSLFTWSGEAPYSQYVELDRSCAETDRLSIRPVLRNVEIDTDGQPDSRRLLVNVSFSAQTVLWGEVPVTLTEDAYYLDGEFAPAWESCALTPCLDWAEQTQTGRFELPADAAQVLDWTCFRDRVVPSPGGERAQGSVSVNLLYRDAEDRVQSRLLRQELTLARQAEPSAEWRCAVELADPPAQQGRELLLPLLVRQRWCQTAPMRNLCGGTLKKLPRPEGPSLLVRTASGELWDIARDNGSTVRAIRAANELEELCLARERLLLIPTGRGVTTVQEVSK